MKVSPFQLAIIAVGGFASIIMLNVLSKYQSNEDFRTQLSNMKPSELLSIRTRRVAEEHMETVPTSVDETEDDDDGA